MSPEEPRRPRTEPVDGCPVCGGDADELFRRDDGVHQVPGSYRYRRCRRCRTVFQDPRVVAEDRPLLYPDAYYTHAPPGPAPPAPSPSPPPAAPGARGAVRRAVVRAAAPREGEERAGRAARLLGRSRWLRERAFGDQVMDEMLPWRRPAGSALDVGCGAGALLPRLAAVGWEPEGLEWDPEAARVARERSGMPVRAGSAQELSAEAGRYRLVTLVHVFEHLADPVGALRGAARILEPDGRVVLVYPNPESLLRRLFGPDWYGWEVPRHLTLLPAGALERAAGRAGLRVRRLRTLARWATSLCRQSRDLRAGRWSGPTPTDPRPGPADRALGAVERAAVALGLEVGEELVAVLERDGS